MVRSGRDRPGRDGDRWRVSMGRKILSTSGQRGGKRFLEEKSAEEGKRTSGRIRVGSAESGSLVGAASEEEKLRFLVVALRRKVCELRGPFSTSTRAPARVQSSSRATSRRGIDLSLLLHRCERVFSQPSSDVWSRVCAPRGPASLSSIVCNVATEVQR